MYLSDIFEQLQYGELSHLIIGDLSDQEIKKKVIAQINLALLELHKRFWLISKNIIVHLYDYVYEYTIDRRYLVSNQISPEAHRYIVDSAYSPFLNDLLKIEKIYNSKAEELILNDEKDSSSFFTPQYNILRVPVTYRDSLVSVQYRANHQKITVEDIPEKTELTLPEAFLEPLLLFIGHRVSRILNSDQNQESNNYLQQFELACTSAKNYGYGITSERINSKLDVAGWV